MWFNVWNSINGDNKFYVYVKTNTTENGIVMRQKPHE